MKQAEAARIIIEREVMREENRLREYVGLGCSPAATAEVSGKLKGLRFALAVLTARQEEAS